MAAVTALLERDGPSRANASSRLLSEKMSQISHPQSQPSYHLSRLRRRLLPTMPTIVAYRCDSFADGRMGLPPRGSDGLGARGPHSTTGSGYHGWMKLAPALATAALSAAV